LEFLLRFDPIELKEEQIRSNPCERLGAKARGITAYICKAYAGKTIKEVSDYFHKGETRELNKKMPKVKILES